jgi:hypothetical protein
MMEVLKYKMMEKSLLIKLIHPQRSTSQKSIRNTKKTKSLRNASPEIMSPVKR